MPLRSAGPLGQTSIQRESRELRPYFVRDLDNDGLLINVTTASVEVGFARGRDRPSTWTAAAWAVGGPFDSPIGQAWAAEISIGGTGTGADVELTPGEWRAYVRVNTGDEEPVLDAGILTVV